ncbi:hypothetical protein [Arthrobacter sp. NicSoilB8]|uniref:hypothetical protein n=1 Tax=Arthrobacter sp. NicSoilB8 TaxID=2830998 RepID=UPI001CC404FF|nr:hypothetical protein [Arthrobacter sp. NicSoilB8]BCW71119.1 hypothetical protein NicSoilB8_21630 [Arthrobacter sp. NicSoilB8]
MRWPWQRGTDQPRTDRAPREPLAPAAIEPPVAPAGWAFLPPMQRSTGSIQLTSDPDHFAGSLASWGDPSFTGPMSHLVSTQAPAGVIDVDGGGPVPGYGGYAAPSMEMTLLPPPAPRISPLPGRLGGLPTTAQRAESGGRPDGDALDGGTLDGGTLDNGSLDGGSLLAAPPEAFPVLHVDAEPLQAAGPSLGRPVSMPVPHPEPSGQALPGRSDGSTSDGSATYVPLPSAGAVQRTSAAADSSPSIRQAPHPPRLGLGMPLSFTEPAESPESFRGTGSMPFSGTAAVAFPGATSGAFPLPVQRTPDLPPPGPPAGPPAADANTRGAADAIPPGAGAGTATGPETTAAVSSDPPNFETEPEPDPGIDEPAPEADTGTAAATISPPSEVVPSEGAPPSDDGAAPLLSATVSSGALDPAGDSSAGVERPAPRIIEGNPAGMPVVSRSGPAADPVSEVNDAGHGSDSVATLGEASFRAMSFPAVSFSEVPETARPVTGPPERALTAHPDIPRADERPHAAAAALPLVLGPAAERQTMPADSPAVQRSIGNDAPGETAPSAAERTVPAIALEPAPGPSAESSSDAPRVDGRTDAGNPATNESSTPHDSLGIQRPASPAPDQKARAIPTTAGPVVLRIVSATGPVPAPATWQPLTTLPVAAPAPRTALVPATATLSGQLPANTAGPDEGQRGVAAAAAAFAPSADMLPGAGGGFDVDGELDFRTESGRAAGAASREEPDAPPGPSAAVGRVIQRTISVERYPAVGPGPSDAVAARFPAGSVATTQMLIPSAPVQPRGGEQRARVQRLSAPAGPVTGAAGSTPERTATLGNFPNTSFTMGPTGTAAHPVAGSGSEMSQAAILSLAFPSPHQDEGGEAVQRETGHPGMDSPSAMPVVPASASGATEEAGGGIPVQGGTDATPAGAARQEQAAGGVAARGAAASGIPAGATPEQLEDLAKRLAGPLIRRIKAEMLLDRERRGLRTDTN